MTYFTDEERRHVMDGRKCVRNQAWNLLVQDMAWWGSYKERYREVIDFFFENLDKLHEQYATHLQEGGK